MLTEMTPTDRRIHSLWKGSRCNTGELAKENHIIPRSVCPELDNALITLEFLPETLNQFSWRRSEGISGPVKIQRGGFPECLPEDRIEIDPLSAKVVSVETQPSKSPTLDRRSGNSRSRQNREFLPE